MFSLGVVWFTLYFWLRPRRYTGRKITESFPPRHLGRSSKFSRIITCVAFSFSERLFLERILDLLSLVGTVKIICLRILDLLYSIEDTVAMANNFLTNRQLALCEFPMLPQLESQRKSSSRTQATRPRTFKELRIWESFNSDARDFAMGLTDEPHLSLPNILHPMQWALGGLDVASSEIAVHGTLERILFHYVNNLARNIGLHFEYGGAGSGRSNSRTDTVILDRFVAQNMTDLSERVYGVGEVKGSWQWEIRSTHYAQQFLDDDKQEMLLEVTQQMYGDMVVDEAIVGFISNYNQTIFFYRDDAKSKSLYFSPLVDISDAPVEKFLYVLHRAQSLKIIKRELSRNIVELAPVKGYQLEGVVPDISPSSKRRPKIVVKATKRKRRDISTSSTYCSKLHTYGEYNVNDIPTYLFDAIGFTGGVVGLGKYGNVFEG